jgi:D-proline reductase (dithiol) PrdB
VKPPRALHLRYPFGHPMGEAFAVTQQRTILLTALQALATITEPGTILEPGWAWRRHRFA